MYAIRSYYVRGVGAPGFLQELGGPGPVDHGDDHVAGARGGRNRGEAAQRDEGGGRDPEDARQAEHVVGSPGVGRPAESGTNGIKSTRPPPEPRSLKRPPGGTDNWVESPESSVFHGSGG